MSTKRVHLFGLIVCCAGVSLALAADGPRFKLANGDFEKGREGRPARWAAKRVKDISMKWDTKVAHKGQRSYYFQRDQGFFPFAQLRQRGRHVGSAGTLHVSAWVKAAKTHKAIVDVQYKAGGEEAHAWAIYIGAKEQNDPPADHDWKEYKGAVEIPAGCEWVGVALQMYGLGEVWFDDLAVRFEAGDKADEVEKAGKDADGDALEVGDLPDDVKDIPVTKRPLPRQNQRYFLIGQPAEAINKTADADDKPAETPVKKRRLMLVMPGGDGGEDFLPFVMRLHRRFGAEDWVFAQLIAPRWSPEQAEKLVWPTRRNRVPEAKLATEQIIADVIADVRQQVDFDPEQVYVLGWSSGGPAAYTAALDAQLPIRGAVVLMSVFKPQELPSLARAKDKRFAILHSPTDFIPLDMAKRACDTLRKHGGSAELYEYAGGHGWHPECMTQLQAAIPALIE